MAVILSVYDDFLFCMERRLLQTCSPPTDGAYRCDITILLLSTLTISMVSHLDQGTSLLVHVAA